MADHTRIANALEKQHLIDLLNTDRRLDGRSKNEFRDIKIETNVIGTANGSALVHLGKTKIICGVKAVINKPYSDYPNKGSFSVGFENSPLAAPQYRLGPPQPNSIEVARMTDRVIRESQCIDLDSLCLIEGQKIWHLFIDLYAIDDYGNFFDAAPIAALAALSVTKIPETKIDEDGNIEVLETTFPLKINSFPVSITTYKISNHYIIDADMKEELVADMRISFGTTETHIVSGQKGGITGMKSSEVIEVLKEAIKISSNIRETIRQQIDI